MPMQWFRKAVAMRFAIIRHASDMLSQDIAMILQWSRHVIVLFAKSVWISICYRKIIKNASCAEIKFQKKIQNIIREEIVLKSFVQTLNVLILAKK